MKTKTITCITALFGCHLAGAFEGRISVMVTRGGETQTLLHTVGTNEVLIERGEADRPYARNLVARDTGAITLIFPHNRSYVRLKDGGTRAIARVPGNLPSAGVGGEARPLTRGGAAGTVPHNNNGQSDLSRMSMPPVASLPQLPPGIGPQATAPGGAGFNSTMPAMPMMPPMPMEQMKLKTTQDKTNLLGYVCARYELKQRGEVMEIWATDQLVPFQPYLQNQPPRFGPRMMEEQWGGLLKARKLFPLLAVLRSERPSRPAEGGPPDAGPERMRFEVKSITSEKITDETLFQPPPDYHEIQPLSF